VLISYTAQKLWELRDRHFKHLTRNAYQALGGIGGSLARHAESTLAGLPTEDRALVRTAFHHLVTSQNTRAVLAHAELRQLLGDTAHADRVIEHLVASRLLVASDDTSGREMIEIVHEALLITWPRQLLRTMSPSSPSSSGVVAARFSPDGRTIATGSADGLVGLWDIASGSIRRLAGHNGVVVNVSFSDDGTRFVTASIDGTARVWDMTGQVVSILHGRSGGAIRSAQFDGTGRLIATAGVDGVVDLWDAERGQLVATWHAHMGRISNALFDPRRRMLVTAGADGTCALWPMAIEPASIDALDELARCTVPLTRLDSGRLVQRALEPCP
jgi:hypothetical protein